MAFYLMELLLSFSLSQTYIQYMCIYSIHMCIAMFACIPELF